MPVAGVQSMAQSIVADGPHSGGDTLSAQAERTMRAPSTIATVTAMTTGVSDISALRNSSSSNSPSLPGEALLRIIAARQYMPW